MANTKIDLIALSDIIRKKYQQLKAGQKNESLALEATFKPIVEPLKKLVAYKKKEGDEFIASEPIRATPIKQPSTIVV